MNLLAAQTKLAIVVTIRVAMIVGKIAKGVKFSEMLL